jgi:1-acyl-sn-glycerol-3-phosphate acyltransferase
MRFLWPLINAFQWVVACVWTAGWVTVALIVSAVRGRPDPGLALARLVWGPGLVHLAGARLRIEGRERIDPSRAYFFAANHQSWMDIPVMFADLPVPVLFLAKRELARVPFLGRYIEKMGMLFVDRANRREAMRTMEHAAARLREGRSLLSFPEGTRTPDGRVQRFKTASFAAALEAGVPVVPVAIEGARRVMPRDSFRVRPGVIHVRMGDPVPTSGLTRDDRAELASRVQWEVEKLLEEMRASRPATPPPPAAGNGPPPARGSLRP